MRLTLGYALLGILAGCSGCFGIGGGIIILPVLALFFKTDWPIFWVCVLAGAIGAVAGSLVIQKVPAICAKRTFAVFLLYAAARLWVK